MTHEYDPPLTGAQLDYLACFDRFLRNEPGSHAAKSQAFSRMLDEAEVRPRSNGRRARHTFRAERYAA